MRTATYTTTSTRLQLVEANLRVAVHRLHHDPQRFMPSILEPMVRGKLLRKLVFQGLDGDDAIRAQFTLTVDWLEHDKFAAVQGRLRVDRRSIQQGAPELRGLLESFEEVVAEGGLRVALILCLRRDKNTAELRHRLGLRDTPRRSWVGQQAETSFPLRDLREMTVSLALADDDEEGL